MGEAATIEWQGDYMDNEPKWNSTVELGWQFKDDPFRLISHFKALTDRYPMSGRAKFELASALDCLGEEAQAIPFYEEACSQGLSEEYEAYARLQL